MKTRSTVRPHRTRAESKADTRERVLAAAARVFRRDGYHRASLDRVAAEAGYTKGAVYAAFESKASLFLELLARRAASRRADLEQIMESAATSEDFVAGAARQFARSAEADTSWWATVIEFMTSVARDEQLRRRYAVHHDATRASLADAIESWARRTGRRLPMSARRIATLALAVNNGITLEALIAPREVPARTYVDGQLALFRGLIAGPATGDEP